MGEQESYSILSWRRWLCFVFDRSSFPYDLTFIKEHETGSVLRVLGRIALIMSIGCAGYTAYSMPAFLAWGAIYSVMHAAWFMLLRAMPEKINARSFVFVLTTSILYGISYSWIVWYMWGSDKELLHFAALVALATAMINAVSMRSDDKLMAATDFIIAVLTLFWMISDYVLREGFSKDGIFFIVLMLAWVTFWIISITDASTARKRLQRSYEIEVEQNKIQALGHLTGGVAHDFNNLLTVIIGNLDLRREVDLPPEDEEELLEEVSAAARKASVLTSQLLAFSRRSPLQERVVDLSEVISEAQLLLGRLLPATHRLTIAVDTDLPKTRVDVDKLETVIVNLAMNARDAMPTGGDIVVSTRRVTYPKGRSLPESPNAYAGSTLPPGKYIELSVRDEGAGIPGDILAKVLDPYFTTKPIGKGSGLGLSMALGFAEQSGGTLQVSSVLREGTRVTLWFPVVEETDESDAANKPA